ncbi:hypothetical protein F1210_003005 [Clostridioides difficile]
MMEAWTAKANAPSSCITGIRLKRCSKAEYEHIKWLWVTLKARSAALYENINKKMLCGSELLFMLGSFLLLSRIGVFKQYNNIEVNKRITA